MPTSLEPQVSSHIADCEMCVALFSVNLCVCNWSSVSDTCKQLRCFSRLPGVKLFWTSVSMGQPAGFYFPALLQVSFDISRVVLQSVNFNVISMCVFHEMFAFMY